MNYSHNTVIAVYDSLEQARNARQALLDSGVISSNVQLSSEPVSSTSTENTLPSERAAATQNYADQNHESGIAHFFRSLFGMDDTVEDKEHYNVYAESVRRGSYILKAHVNNDQEAEQITTILNRFQPIDIDERSAQWREQGWKGYDASAPVLSQAEIEKDRSTYRTTSSSAGLKPTVENQAATTANTGLGTATRPAINASNTAAGTTTIPVIQEELKVGKRVVQRGGVKVFQRIQAQPVRESVNLREEEVHIERHPVNKPATASDMAAFKEGTLEVTALAEEPVVAKTARVVEEVVVGKESHQHTQQINDTVRRTEVEVEKVGGKVPPQTNASTINNTVRR